MDDSNRSTPPSPHRADDPPLTEAAQAAYFARVREASEHALSCTASRSVDIDLAGTRCCLRFAGQAVMNAFLPALQHLVLEADGDPDVTLHIWDSQSSGVTMPPPPVPHECFSSRGDIWRMESRRFDAAFHWIESSVNLFDRESRLGIFWVPGTELLPFWSKASPFRTLFHWWIESVGGQLIHGACFGRPEGAILLTGRGGVGKSTTTLLALQHGLSYVGDDYLAVRLEPEPRAYSLYCTAKLDGPQMAKFPRLEQLITNQGFRSSEKAVVCLLPDFQQQVVRSLPLALIATPRFGDGAETRAEPATAIALQRAASYTTMAQLPGSGSYLHSFMHRLVATLPGLTLALGSDLQGVVPAIDRLLDSSESELRAISADAATPVLEPLVNVIIPVYNGAHFLPAAVESVLSQGYSNLEIVVVDDGSTDNLAEVIRTLPVEVRLLQQENAGPAAARNHGIRDTAGALLAFLDVDDLWPAENLKHLVAQLTKHPEVLAVHGKGQLWRSTEQGHADIGDPLEAYPYYIGAGLYRREAFVQNGLFDAQLRYGEDTDWYMRAAERRLPILELDEVSLLIRRHASNMTRGKTLEELNTLRVIKLALDRRRASEAVHTSA